jgi:hypothetical protein
MLYKRTKDESPLVGACGWRKADMGWIRKKVTPAVVVANRRNSRKSTGPRTAAGKRRVGRNAGKYFVFGQVTPERMRQLGEKPSDFEKLRHRLWTSIKPRDGFEEILIEEMAVNLWRLARLRRAEIGMLVNQRDDVEIRLESYPYGEEPPRQPIRFKSRGLGGLIDSTVKYQQILFLLGLVYSGAKAQGFEEADIDLLEVVYRMCPSEEGRVRLELLRQVLENSEPTTSVNQGVEPNPQIGNEEPEKTEAQETLLMSLEEEIEKNRLYLATQTQLRTNLLPDSVKDALLMLPEGESEHLMRYEAMLQRGFERSMKQLLDWRNRRGEAKIT